LPLIPTPTTHLTIRIVSIENHHARAAVVNLNHKGLPIPILATESGIDVSSLKAEIFANRSMASGIIVGDGDALLPPAKRRSRPAARGVDGVPAEKARLWERRRRERRSLRRKHGNTASVHYENAIGT
jgi:hypothetical protein